MLAHTIFRPNSSIKYTTYTREKLSEWLWFRVTFEMQTVDWAPMLPKFYKKVWDYWYVDASLYVILPLWPFFKLYNLILRKWMLLGRTIRRAGYLNVSEGQSMGSWFWPLRLRFTKRPKDFICPNCHGTKWMDDDTFESFEICVNCGFTTDERKFKSK